MDSIVISYFDFDFRNNYTALDKLDISECCMTKSLPKDLLTAISKTKVTELYLTHLPITRVIHGDLPPMPNLKVLHLDYNQITYLDEFAFSGLENLQTLR